MGNERLQERRPRGGAVQRPLQFRHGDERFLEHDKVARVTGADAEPRQRPFHVAHAMELLAKIRQDMRRVAERPDDTLPQADLFDILQRTRQPFPQQPRAHRRQRAVHAADQGVPAVGARRFEQFEVPLRRRVEHHEIADAVDSETVNMRRAASQGLLQVMQRRARRADAHAQRARAKAIQRLRLEMVAQREERRFALKRPAVMRRDRQRQSRQQQFRFVEPFGGHDDLRGPRAREFVVQLLGGQQLGDFEIAGREIDEREPKFVATRRSPRENCSVPRAADAHRNAYRG